MYYQASVGHCNTLMLLLACVATVTQNMCLAAAVICACCCVADRMLYGMRVKVNMQATCSTSKLSVGLTTCCMLLLAHVGTVIQDKCALLLLTYVHVANMLCC
jgi:hypothetical protein